MHLDGPIDNILRKLSLIEQLFSVCSWLIEVFAGVAFELGMAYWCVSLRAIVSVKSD